jgi:hypothetical protein
MRILQVEGIKGICLGDMKDGRIEMAGPTFQESFVLYQTAIRGALHMKWPESPLYCLAPHPWGCLLVGHKRVSLRSTEAAMGMLVRREPLNVHHVEQLQELEPCLIKHSLADSKQPARHGLRQSASRMLRLAVLE